MILIQKKNSIIGKAKREIGLTNSDAFVDQELVHRAQVHREGLVIVRVVMHPLPVCLGHGHELDEKLQPRVALESPTAPVPRRYPVQVVPSYRGLAAEWTEPHESLSEKNVQFAFSLIIC